MVHVTFDPTKQYPDELFQEGYGLYYEANPYQRGYGIQYGIQYGGGVGDAFRRLVRFIIPHVKEAGRVLKTEGLATGARILNDVAHGIGFKKAVATEAKTGLRHLADRAAERYARAQAGAGKRKRKRKTSTTAKRVITKRSRLVGRSVPVETISRRRRVDSLGFY